MGHNHGQYHGFSEAQLLGYYDGSLNESYDPIEISNCTFMPAEVLKKCDPEAYRDGFLDYLDTEGYIEDPNGVLDYVHVSDLKEEEEEEEDRPMNAAEWNNAQFRIAWRETDPNRNI